MSTVLNNRCTYNIMTPARYVECEIITVLSNPKTYVQVRGEQPY
jgi:hypothetical protein